MSENFDVLSEAIAENDDYEDEESNYDSREDENNDAYYDTEDSSHNFDADDYDSYDSYNDYLPSDRRWSEDDSDRQSEPEHHRVTSSSFKASSLKIKDIPESEAIDISDELNILDHQTSHNSTDLNLVKNKLEMIAKNIKCVVCLSNKVQILTVPCGHIVMCGECAINSEHFSSSGSSSSNSSVQYEEETERCPLCRKVIENKIIARLP